jgi:hypothetical protein
MAGFFLKSQQLLSCSRNSGYIVEPEALLTCSYALANGLCTDRRMFDPHLSFPFTSESLHITLHFLLGLLSVPFFHISYQNAVCTFPGSTQPREYN